MIKKYIDDIDDIDFRWGTGRDCEFFGSAFGDRWWQHAGGAATHHIPAREKSKIWLAAGWFQSPWWGWKTCWRCKRARVWDPKMLLANWTTQALFVICRPFAIHLPPVLRVNLEELSVCDGRARSQVQIGPETWIFGLDLGLGSFCGTGQHLVPKSIKIVWLILNKTWSKYDEISSSCLGLLWQHGISPWSSWQVSNGCTLGACGLSQVGGGFCLAWHPHQVQLWA